MSGSEMMDAPEANMFTAEYKDGQLQIVEVSPYDNHKVQEVDTATLTLEDITPAGADEKSLVHLDLLNWTLVKCEESDGTYKLIANTGDTDGSYITDNSVTCVLQAEGACEEQDEQNSFVIMDSDTTYYLTDTENNLPQNTEPEIKVAPKKRVLSKDMVERARAIRRVKESLMKSIPVSGRRGRKPKSETPPTQKITFPSFKLYLYSCKLCSFKCNAVKEMTEHKTKEHGAPGVKKRLSSATLQCARCPYRGNTHTQLMQHIQDKHLEPDIERENQSSEQPVGVSLNSAEVAAADVLVCGACGYESSSRQHFKDHIEQEHGATTH